MQAISRAKVLPGRRHGRVEADGNCLARQRRKVSTEADTCRKFVVPRLQTAGWEGAPHAINEQRTFTDGRVIFIGGKAKRGRQKRADYILRYRADYPIAVVEAKAAYKSAADGLQQAKDYAEILGL